MDGRGRRIPDGQGGWVPQTRPPCWSCPKQPEEVPPADRKPLPLAADFGGWVWDLLDWFHAGRATKFGDVPPLLGAVAAAIDREERAGEREDLREAVRAGVADAFRRGRK